MVAPGRGRGDLSTGGTGKGTAMNYANEIRDFVVSNFLFGDAGPLQNDTSFMGGGILDSTGILELVSFLETKYSIRVETEEMLPSNLDSVNNTAQFLASKLGQTSRVSAGLSGRLAHEVPSYA